MPFFFSKKKNINSLTYLRQMEALYAKLYDKYTKLKTKKLSELDKINKEQEVKFVNCVTAAEELIQHLQKENERLSSQVDDLRSELYSIRSSMDKQCAEYQNLLMEENQKNKALTEEVERLRKLEQEGIFSCSRHNKTDNEQLSTPHEAQTESEELCGRTHKRKRHSRSETEDMIIPCGNGHDTTMLGEPSKDLHKEAVSSGALLNNQQPECCRRIINRSGGAVNDSFPANCMFQHLVENLVGMKFSTVTQSEGICISAMHQSSGYSFSLTWVESGGTKEAEFVYRTLSLGTFDRVAPDWMKEVIIFSTTMCPVFFDRVSRVVKLHC
ncbi:uncharacterized protein LOC107410801 isoform X1 [Ziziphus jujuba]|uniref:Uncharacterized protein LOC107410801 isoform X1 n=4 Tax=Ziziphus jujuba TaxID=326968 RepID=A0ABM3ZTN1_ZIZJJ|nr:uncharacterized protein LOC107410801 isoform X1 [Ziziphus jujuba]